MRQSFDEWMAAVNDIIERRLGLSAADLPDFCYRDAYEDEATPREAARDALRAAAE